MKKFLLFLCLLLIFKVYSQNSVFITNKGDVYSSKLYGQYLYFMVGGNNAYYSQLYRMKLPDGAPEAIDTNILFGQSVIMGDSGVFYISFAYDANGNDGKHTLNFMPSNNTQKRELKVINDFVEHPYRTLPLLPKLLNGKYYISSWFNNKNCIWESDGSLDGTRITYTSTSEIKDYSIYQNKPIVIAGNNQKYFVVNDQNQKLSPEYSWKNNSPFYFYYTSNSVCIYTINKKLYLCGEVGKVDSLSLNFNGFRTFTIVKQSDSILQGYNYVGNTLYTYSMRIKAPFTYDSLPPSAAILSMQIPRFDLTNNSFLSFWNFSTGCEMIYSSFDDSIRLIKDLNPGHSSGISNITRSGDLFQQDGIAYFSASNGSDGKNYLYTSDGHYMKSHFPWGNIYSHTQGLCIKDSQFFWCSFYKDTLLIGHQNLYGRDTQLAPHPKIRERNNGEWLRTLSPVSVQYQYPNNIYNNNLTSQMVAADPSGNVFVCGLATNYDRDYLIRFSDTDAIQPFNGDYFIAKYDSSGNLLWFKSVGKYDNWSSRDAAFNLDRNGDVIIFSNYFQHSDFDSLQLNTSRSAMFVCKLNGLDGKVKWVKQFNPTMYSNDNTTNKIVSDHSNNIYLSFSFRNFVANINQLQIISDRSPSNGLVKLDPDGNVIWAKANSTPWTDKYGISRDMAYDSVSNSIYNLIGQGFYNWSASCRYAPFRSILYNISTDGDIQSLQALEGNDLNASTIAEITKSKSVFVSGYYRSNFGTPPYAVASPYDSKTGCYKWEQYYANIEAKNGHLLSLHSTQNDAFYPFDACSDAQYIYVLGAQKYSTNTTSGNYILCIRRYTHLGRYKGSRLFVNCYTYDPFDFNFYYNISSSGSYLLLSMNSISRISPFNNFVENYEGLSVYRLLKEKDWRDEQNFNEKIPESGILIAPNPASEYLNLQFYNPGDYKQLEIYDALGRLVLSSDLSGEMYEQISISELSSGVYTILFKGTMNHTEKLIVR